jgi:hypothetical protein
MVWLIGCIETSLFASLSGQLYAGDIIVGDRGFGSYLVIAWLTHHLGVDFIGCTTRRVDGRQRLKRLGANDWLVLWQPGTSVSSPWLGAEQREQQAAQMIVRAIKGCCQQKGVCVRQLIVVTTLLDPLLYRRNKSWRPTCGVGG